jgi:hypothetical protein
MPDDLKTLSAELGIAALSPDEQEQVVANWSTVALEAATLAVLEKLPEGKREEFATLAEAGEPATLQAFLDREVPGHEAIAGQAVREELTHFKESIST